MLATAASAFRFARLRNPQKALTPLLHRQLTDGATAIQPPDAIKQNRQLVGRLLGNVVRDSRGKAVYEKVESIRKLCVAFRKTKPGSPEALALKLQLDVLFAGSIEERIDIIRAFSEAGQDTMPFLGHP